MDKGEKIRFGIVTKLMLVFIVMIVLSLGFVAFSSHMKATELIVETENNFSKQMLREMEDAIEIYIEGFERQLLKMSTQASVETLLTQIDATSSASQTEGAEGSGNEESVMWMMKDFTSIIETNKDIKQISLVSKNKDIYTYPSMKFKEGYDPTTEAWYKDATSAKKLSWTQPHLNGNTKEMLITAGLPIYNENKELIGVLSMDLSLKTLSEKMNGKIIGEKGYPMILDNKGNVIIHKDDELIGEPVPAEEIMNAIKERNEGEVPYLRVEDEISYEKNAVFSKLEKLDWIIMSTMYMDEITKATNVLLKNIVIVAVITVLITILILFTFSNKMTKNMKLLLTNMELIKQGDLTVKSNFSSNDEIGKLSETFNGTLDTVAKLIRDVQLVAAETTDSAQRLAAAAQESTASTEEVTSAVSEIAIGAAGQAKEADNGVKLTSKLSKRFNQLTHNTHNMSDSAGEAIETMNEGIKAVGDLQRKTKLNTESTVRIETAIVSLSNKIENIDNFLKTISDIAEQTNLLALNAAIEAARAGEHGRGFAVVAEEIRKLATGSSKAAEEIYGIIEDVQLESNKSVETMKEVKLRSEEQTEAVGMVDKTFDGIKATIEKITEKIESTREFVKNMNEDNNAIVVAIEGISAISEETSASSEQVTATMEQQASSMEEIARDAEKLTQLATNLNREIDKFKVV